MPNIRSNQPFLRTEKATELRTELESMVKNPLYNTRLYTMLTDASGDRFIEKHMHYMSTHPTIDHWQYISNIKLMTKLR